MKDRKTFQVKSREEILALQALGPEGLFEKTGISPIFPLISENELDLCGKTFEIGEEVAYLEHLNGFIVPNGKESVGRTIIQDWMINE